MLLFLPVQESGQEHCVVWYLGRERDAAGESKGL